MVDLRLCWDTSHILPLMQCQSKTKKKDFIDRRQPNNTYATRHARRVVHQATWSINLDFDFFFG